MYVALEKKDTEDTDEIWELLTAEGPICIETQGEVSISSPNKQRLS